MTVPVKSLYITISLSGLMAQKKPQLWNQYGQAHFLQEAQLNVAQYMEAMISNGQNLATSRWQYSTWQHLTKQENK